MEVTSDDFRCHVLINLMDLAPLLNDPCVIRQTLVMGEFERSEDLEIVSSQRMLAVIHVVEL